MKQLFTLIAAMLVALPSLAYDQQQPVRRSMVHPARLMALLTEQ